VLFLGIDRSYCGAKSVFRGGNAGWLDPFRPNPHLARPALHKAGLQACVAAHFFFIFFYFYDKIFNVQKIGKL